MIALVGGLVIDGSGRPGQPLDLRIEGSTISELAPPGTLRGPGAIDVSGLVIAPGFIDAHVHADLALLEEPAMEGLIRQGVTTVILGQDGMGYAPGSPATTSFMASYAAGINGPGWAGVGWSSVKGYLDALDGGTVHNAAYLVPHGCVRSDVIGLDERIASDDELARITLIVARGMAEGAVGVSTGLHYVPAVHADTRELVALGRGASNGVFVTHMRDYESGRAAAIEESITVGREAGCRVHISHLNMRAHEGLPAIDRARDEGVSVTYDTYPYLYGMTLLSRVLPAAIMSVEPETLLRQLGDPGVRFSLRSFMESPERRWETKRFGAIVAPEFQALEGMTPEEAAAVQGRTVTDLICDVLIACRLEVAVIGSRHHRQTESDVEDLMRHDAHVFGSDGILVGATTHPRAYGTFAKVLGEYVHDRSVLSLEGAIEHMTLRTAQIFGLNRRGHVAAGSTADLAVFDPATIRDTATFESPRSLANGVEHVFVNGVSVLRDRSMTGLTPGRAIRGRVSGAAA